MFTFVEYAFFILFISTTGLIYVGSILVLLREKKTFVRGCVSCGGQLFPHETTCCGLVEGQKLPEGNVYAVDDHTVNINGTLYPQCYGDPEGK